MEAGGWVRTVSGDARSGDQLPELPGLGAGIASGGAGMRWLYAHVNRSGDGVTATSCILGREKGEDVFSFFACSCPENVSSSLTLFCLYLQF